MPEKLLTIDEAADFLRYSKRYLYNLVANRQISCVRIGPKKTALRFTKEGLEAYVNGNRVVSDSELMSKAEKMLQGEK